MKLTLQRNISTRQSNNSLLHQLRSYCSGQHIHPAAPPPLDLPLLAWRSPPLAWDRALRAALQVVRAGQPGRARCGPVNSGLPTPHRPPCTAGLRRQGPSASAALRRQMPAAGPGNNPVAFRACTSHLGPLALPGASVYIPRL